MFKSSQTRGFRVVTGSVRGHKIIDGVIGMPGPRQEMINLPAGHHRRAAVEAPPMLGVTERPAYAVEADPLGAEQELVEAFGINQIRVVSSDPGDRLGLHQRPDQRSEPYQPAAHSGAQVHPVIKIRAAHHRTADFFPPGEVVDERPSSAASPRASAAAPGLARWQPPHHRPACLRWAQTLPGPQPGSNLGSALATRAQLRVMMTE